MSENLVPIAVLNGWLIAAMVLADEILKGNPEHILIIERDKYMEMLNRWTEEGLDLGLTLDTRSLKIGYVKKVEG